MLSKLKLQLDCYKSLVLYTSLIYKPTTLFFYYSTPSTWLGSTNLGLDVYFEYSRKVICKTNVIGPYSTCFGSILIIFFVISANTRLPPGLQEQETIYRVLKGFDRPAGKNMSCTRYEAPKLIKGMQKLQGVWGIPSPFLVLVAFLLILVLFCYTYIYPIRMFCAHEKYFAGYISKVPVIS